MKIQKIIAAASVALLLTGLGASAAYADSPEKTKGSDTIVVSGQQLGPEDGLRVVTESYAITPGGDPVGATYPTTPPKGPTPQLVWGSSYAYSQEYHSIQYTGYAKAAGNVYNGERIVRVCFWWTQANRTSVTTCADATYSGGYWYASPEAQALFEDSLDPNAPQTIFNIQTSRIDP
ncbi:hypothetical protein, partial [Cryobacterium sp. MLB-32]|uniref:hypothetical protein n=1 Tax=Cryobacterium sp. MLB-32 TaxID=1529318 RepID=UPI0005634875